MRHTCWVIYPFNYLKHFYHIPHDIVCTSMWAKLVQIAANFADGVTAPCVYTTQTASTAELEVVIQANTSSYIGFGWKPRSSGNGPDAAVFVLRSVRWNLNLIGLSFTKITIYWLVYETGWLGDRVVSLLDSGAVGPWFRSQPRRCRVTVLGKLFTPIVPLFTIQRNW